jgi:hypothetical protein
VPLARAWSSSPRAAPIVTRPAARATPAFGTICEAAERAGFTYVGRLRTAGDWPLTFYGRPGQEKKLEQLVVDACGERGHRTASREDGGWSYYDSFLLPDAERWQWILNRRVVHQLAEAGDHHATARPVDHYVHFDEPDARDAFAAAAKGLQAESTEESGERPCGAHLVRTDRVELGQFHRVVMELRVRRTRATMRERPAFHGGASVL